MDVSAHGEFTIYYTLKNIELTVVLFCLPITEAYCQSLLISTRTTIIPL